jgi:hypothetical protein
MGAAKRDVGMKNESNLPKCSNLVSRNSFRNHFTLQATQESERCYPAALSTQYMQDGDAQIFRRRHNVLILTITCKLSGFIGPSY